MVVSTCRNQRLNTKKGPFSQEVLQQKYNPPNTNILTFLLLLLLFFGFFFFNRNIHFYILLDLWIVLFDNTVPPLEFMPES